MLTNPFSYWAQIYPGNSGVRHRLDRRADRQRARRRRRADRRSRLSARSPSWPCAGAPEPALGARRSSAGCCSSWRRSSSPSCPRRRWTSSQPPSSWRRGTWCSSPSGRAGPGHRPPTTPAPPRTCRPRATAFPTSGGRRLPRAGSGRARGTDGAHPHLQPGALAPDPFRPVVPILVVAGIGAGVAVGVKTTNLLAIGVLVLVLMGARRWGMVSRGARHPPRPRRAQGLIGHAACFALPALVLGGCWYVRNVAALGQSVLPRCSLAGLPGNPDVVALLGVDPRQVGTTNPFWVDARVLGRVTCTGGPTSTAPPSVGSARTGCPCSPRPYPWRPCCSIGPGTGWYVWGFLCAGRLSAPGPVSRSVPRAVHAVPARSRGRGPCRTARPAAARATAGAARRGSAPPPCSRRPAASLWAMRASSRAAGRS